MEGLSRYFSRAFVLGRSFSKAVDNSVVQNLDYSLRIVIIGGETSRIGELFIDVSPPFLRV